jgi:hypothetical protein
MSSRHRVQVLLQHPGIWRAGQARASQSSLLSTGYPELDRMLRGGWPIGSLCELLVDSWGSGEFRLLLPALCQVTGSRDEDHAGQASWSVLINPPYIPYAPALAGAGVNTGRLLVVHCRQDEDVLWAIEQALHSGSCKAVLAWCDRAGPQALRRLQLAAGRGRCWAVLLRSGRCRNQRSPAALRLYLRPMHQRGISIEVFKHRGGRPGHLVMET